MAPNPNAFSTDLMEVDDNLNYLQYILGMEGSAIDELFDFVPQSLVYFNSLYFLLIFILGL